MYYEVKKNLIRYYIDAANNEFTNEWYTGKFDNDFWDHKEYVTKRFEDYNCYVTHKPMRGRPPKVPAQHPFYFHDIKTICFKNKNGLDTFRKKWGSTTKKVVTNSDLIGDAHKWLIENVSNENQYVYDAVIGYHGWEIETIDEERNPPAEYPYNIDVFIRKPEHAFEFALRYGVAS